MRSTLRDLTCIPNKSFYKFIERDISSHDRFQETDVGEHGCVQLRGYRFRGHFDQSGHGAFLLIRRRAGQSDGTFADAEALSQAGGVLPDKLVSEEPPEPVAFHVSAVSDAGRGLFRRMGSDAEQRGVPANPNGCLRSADDRRQAEMVRPHLRADRVRRLARQVFDQTRDERRRPFVFDTR